jgi:DNA polymerase
VRRVLQLRADGARSSVAKLQMMLDYASGGDDRMRGMLMYHGASTGRWSGKGPQPHNFPRGTVKDVESLIPFVMERDYDTLNLIAHPLTVVSSMLRSMMCAAPGFDLMAGDYSAIEARVLNWLAGEHGPLDAWRAGKDVYKVNATHLYKVAYDTVTAVQRHTGKFQELACGFGMGAEKAVSAAKTIYQLVITPDEAKAIVANYRQTHPAVVALWREANDACMQAIRVPGVPVVFGANRNIKVFVKGAYMYLVLPSKRLLTYAAPRIVNALAPWGDYIDQVEISAVDGYTGKWGRARLYGGLIIENVVQAVARDIMVAGKLRLEAAAYPVIMSVHDEVITEPAEGFGTLEEFNALLTTPPTWARGCPIAAESWRGKRYKK